MQPWLVWASAFLSVSVTPIGRALAGLYVELFRNLPKLLILLVFFVVAVNGLPPVREAFSVGWAHLSNRSLYPPSLEWSDALWAPLCAGIIGAGAAWSARRLAYRRFAQTGRLLWRWPVGLALIMGAPILVGLLLQTPLVVSVPTFKGFDFQGGVRLSVQFLVVAATLALYHGAQIAEIIRGAVNATPKGQWEAAGSLGLSRRKTLRLVIIPQVVRMIIPPLNSQYVNLIKNTSIAIAVGYSDLMSVAGTTINQTFRPLEMMLLTMGVYLALCLSVAALLNRWSDSIRKREGR